VSNYRNNPLRAQFEASLRAREPIELANVVRSGIRVQLFAPDTLQTGLTTMLVQLTDSASGKTLETASVQIQPVLRSTPRLALRDTPALLQAASTAAVKNFDAMRFPCDVLLLEKGNYEFFVRFSAQGKIDSVSTLAPVRESWRVVKAQGSDGKEYMLTFAEPQRPRVGVQDFSVFVHRLEASNNASYAPVSGLWLEHEPTMPSMGHGSEGNVAPVYRANGRYDGKISFNMTGDWRIDIAAKQGNTTLLETFFFFIL
jgi:hypothetical protein